MYFSKNKITKINKYIYRLRLKYFFSFLTIYHRNYRNERKKVNCGTFFQKIIDVIKNEDIYTEINLIKEVDNKLSSSDEEESVDLSEPSFNKPPKKELKLLKFIIYSIFFLNFINLKMILISKDNFNNIIFNKGLYFYKLICFCIAFSKNNIVLLVIIIAQALILIFSGLGYLYFPKDEEKYYLGDIIISSLIRVYNKDLFILKLYENVCYISMYHFTYIEGIANIFIFIIIFIISIIIPVETFKKSLLFISYILNLAVSIILFCYNEKLVNIFNKINKWNRIPNNEFFLKRIAKNFYAFISALSSILLVAFNCLIPSYFFINNQIFKLFIFILMYFLGRNIICFFGKSPSSLIIISISSFLYIILFYLNFEFESYLLLIIFSFGSGTYFSLTYDNDNKRLYTFYNFSLFILSFMPL